MFEPYLAPRQITREPAMWAHYLYTLPGCPTVESMSTRPGTHIERLDKSKSAKNSTVHNIRLKDLTFYTWQKVK